MKAVLAGQSRFTGLTSFRSKFILGSRAEHTQSQLLVDKHTHCAVNG